MSATSDEVEEFYRRSLSLGAKITGGVVGAIASYATGMPLVGAALSPYVAHSLERVGSDVIRRQLAPRQAERAGRAIAVAAIRIHELQAEGRSPRADGFFDDAPDGGRSVSDEITETVLQAAMNAAQERKIDFMASLMANIAFDASIDASTAHLLVETAERSSYRVFVLLGLMSRIDELGLPRRAMADAPPPPAALTPLLVEIYGMTRAGLTEMKDEKGSENAYAILGIEELDPARLRLTPFGRLLHANLGLNLMPVNDPVLVETKIALEAIARCGGGGSIVDGGTF